MAAILGLTLIALSLTGSIQNAASIPNTAVRSVPASLARQRQMAANLYKAARYAEARELFRAVARQAEAAGITHVAATAWNSAGGSSIVLLQFRDALADFLRARKIAEDTHDPDAFARTQNNLASMYLTMGNEATALSVTREALALPETSTDAGVRAALRFEEAISLADSGHFDEAEPIYRRAAGEFEDLGDLANTARVLGSFGIAALNANRLEESEDALSKAMEMVRVHHLKNDANILRGLAKLKARQSDARSAAVLFQAALDAAPGATPRWRTYADRGDFRLGTGDLQGALEDFRASRHLAAQMRADVVPADQDRVALESGLNRVDAGLVEAGNELALRSLNQQLLEETFSAAEQDRLWSLRALIPEPNDWRTHLPGDYWDVLARYQAAGRDGKAAALQQQLEEMELSAAGGDRNREGMEHGTEAGGELRHVQSVLDAASVLFSFHIGKSSGWVWAADRDRVSVYRIADISSLKADAGALTRQLQQGDEAGARELGKRIYRNLFGGIAKSYLVHSRWLLELDGPLFDVPFSALIAEDGYLAARAALVTIPSALMLKPRAAFRTGEFLGVGDPVYNAADTRYGGDRSKPGTVLPRLPATAPELEACAREWGSKANLLTGSMASTAEVETALDSNPAVIHFATHVIAGPNEYSSGLIALSLDRAGSVGLLGPSEIVAHPVRTQLVVLNGCHSAQGEALPGAGLMGLTRAWIGAGATAVLATRWDIPDEAAKTVATAFYRALRANPGGGPALALQQAQMEVANDGRWPPAVWAAYFLVARE